ncbi:metalloregulator ArsR/SmtB family transcription factor [Curtobacterium sp. MCSS17_005]|uniref:ArsR/SmtB family transcription factor n=1 Tax=Curtobacterium sp. MCSS17_005 TaxID=2175641 RepID=UPI000DA849E7|nr:metalloregulator ArsR/SmtB family transcription factor [Curtobacterium sp. MCSS17_005]MDO3697876.1 metalloregulator ArsR/SmtB family transcription factor [Curtobacterium flaccumfaciens]WIB32264.1 metalloregulator ArsR/SmtB family transcription factor [Curtobacterium sp. MCSS17_005]
MVVRIELSDAEVDRVFHALADATRRDIVRRTLVGSSSVSELADAYSMSFAAVQKHVAVLEGAGLVSKEARGRTRIVRAEPEQLDRVRALLDTYGRLWHTRMDRLGDLLDGDPSGHPAPDDTRRHQER